MLKFNYDSTKGEGETMLWILDIFQVLKRKNVLFAERKQGHTKLLNKLTYPYRSRLVMANATEVSM